MIEDKNFKIGKICSLIKKLSQAELKYKRAQYKVSYYRKIKAAIIGKDPSVFLNRKNMKWKNNLKELNQKIEKARLVALKQQKDNLAIKAKLLKPLNKALMEIGAHTYYKDGSLIGITLGPYGDRSNTIWLQAILERAEQHDVSVSLNKILTK